MLRVPSHAKINWALEIAGRRDDGYHEIRTLFQTVSLADEIVIEAAGRGIELTIEDAAVGRGVLAADSSNLAWRAAQLFLDRFPGLFPGVRIRLRKLIPLGGGLGGGSSNAATVLLALAQLSPEHPSADALVSLAVELGADVPFFLEGGLAVGTGRGDLIRPLADEEIEEEEIWLAMPPFAASTREVFAAAAVSEGGPDHVLANGDWPGALPRRLSLWQGRNDLEAPCFSLHPALRQMYNLLLASGATWVRLSGSGSTLVAIFDETADAERAGAELPEGVEWLRARTLRRSAWRASTGF